MTLGGQTNDDVDEYDSSQDLEQNSQADDELDQNFQPEGSAVTIEHFKAEASKNGCEAKNLRGRLKAAESSLAEARSRVEAYETAEVLAAAVSKLWEAS